MKFTESGLPAIGMVEEAFAYSFANLMASRDDTMKIFQQNIDAEHGHNMRLLNADKQKGMLSDDDYTREKGMLEKMRDDQMKAGPRLVEEELARTFVARRLAPAREIVNNAERAAPEMIMAALLIDCVRSPTDYINIQKEFGAPVAQMIADIVHLEVYPSKRRELLAEAPADTKRTYAAMIVTNLEMLVKQVEQMAKINPGQRLIFPPGQEEQIFQSVKTMWGTDKKLDTRMVDTFNRASVAVASLFRVEVDGAGKPELVKGNTPPPNTPPKKNQLVVKPPVKGGNIGGDVF